MPVKDSCVAFAPEISAPSRCCRKIQVTSQALRTHGNNVWHNADGLITFGAPRSDRFLG
jgi:hypothetical protein